MPIPSVRALRRLAATALLPLTLAAHGAPTTVDFAATVDFIIEDEYGSAQPIPPGAAPLLPLFQGATRVVGRYVYDPSGAIDLDPTAGAGQYITPGSLSISLPELGLTFSSTGRVGFSVYPDSNAGEFHVNGADSFASSGNLGGTTLFGLGLVFYRAPLADDQLPAGPGAWQYANLHISLNGVEPPRDMFFGLAPVPEPGLASLWAAGLLALAARCRRRVGRASAA